MQNHPSEVTGEEIAAPHSSGTTPPRHAAPANATDCHHHIWDPRFQKFGDIHVPPATVADYQRFKRRLGLTRSIVVAPSNYGTDNSCLLDALEQLGTAAARGVAYTPADISTAEIRRLHECGVRAIRVYLDKNQIPSREDVRNLGRKAADQGWSLQFVGTSRTEVFVEWEDTIRLLPCPSVIDHFGWLPQPAGANSKTARTLYTLIESGRTYIKLSGLYLSSAIGFPSYSDLDEVAMRFVSMAPERVIWGSDWPHPGAAIKGPLPDGAMLFDRLAQWAPDASVRHKILVENPDRLYWAD